MTRSTALGLAMAAILVPSAAFAQYAGSYAKVLITLQTAGGASLPSTDIVVNAPSVSLTGMPASWTDNSAGFYSNFNNDSHLATFMGGNYNVLATQNQGYSYQYSAGCSGYLNPGQSSQCTITAYPAGTGTGYIGGNGTLVVYTNVSYPSNSYYYYPTQNFLINVSGITVSPASFQGTSVGTVVSLGTGSYSVSPSNVNGFSVTQSAGCSGTMGIGETRYCTVNYTYQGSSYNPYYPSGTQTLTCTPSYQQVIQNGAANFTAEGGTGVYNWNTGSQTYANAGQTFSTTFSTSGNRAVTVTSGSQTATCYVYVLYPKGTITGESAGLYRNAPGNIYASPLLPDTGFAPQDGAAIAFALAALIAAGIIAAPYVRRIAQSLLG